MFCKNVDELFEKNLEIEGKDYTTLISREGHKIRYEKNKDIYLDDKLVDKAGIVLADNMAYVSLIFVLEDKRIVLNFRISQFASENKQNHFFRDFNKVQKIKDFGHKGVPLETLIYENSITELTIYGGDIFDTSNKIRVGLAENGHIRCHTFDNETFLYNSDKIKCEETIYDNNLDSILMVYKFESDKHPDMKLSFRRNQFSRFNKNEFFFRTKDIKVENKLKEKHA